MVATSAQYFPARCKRQPRKRRFAVSRALFDTFQLFLPAGPFSRLLAGAKRKLFFGVHQQTSPPLRIFLRTVGHGAISQRVAITKRVPKLT